MIKAQIAKAKLLVTTFSEVQNSEVKRSDR